MRRAIDERIEAGLAAADHCHRRAGMGDRHRVEIERGHDVLDRDRRIGDKSARADQSHFLGGGRHEINRAVRTRAMGETARDLDQFRPPPLALSTAPLQIRSGAPAGAQRPR